MALQTQNVDVQLTSGLDTKSDDFSVISSKLAVLTNGKFVDKNSVATRPGMRPVMTSNFASSPTPANISRLSLRSDNLVLEGSNGFFQVNQPLGNQQIAPTFNRCLATLEGVEHRPLPARSCDVAEITSSGLVATVWIATDSNPASTDNVRAGQAWLRVSRAGTELFRSRLDAIVPFDDPPTGVNAYAAGAFYPRVVATDSKFHCYWYENTAVSTNGLGIRTFDPSTMTLGSQGTIAGFGSSSASGPPLDVVYAPFARSGAGAVFVTYSDGDVISQTLAPADGRTIIKTTTRTVSNAPTAVRAIALPTTLTTARPAYVTVAVQSGGVDVVVADLDNASPAATHSILVGATTPTGRVGLVADPLNAATFWIAYDAGDTLISTFVAVQSFSSSPVASQASVQVARHLNVASDMWVRNKALYVGAYLPGSSLQTTWYAVQVGVTSAVAAVNLFAGGLFMVSVPDADICARISLQSAVGSFDAQGNPPRVIDNGAGVVFTAMLRGDDNLVAYNANGGLAPCGIDLITLDYVAQLNYAQIENNVVFAGADPHVFDGARLVELGFEYFPEGVTLTDGGAGNSGGVAGTYFAVAVFEWTDVNGQLYRSPPSVPVSVTVAANHFLNATVPMLRLTQKNNARVALFLTTANGSVFYRQGDEPNNPLIDSKGVAVISRALGTTGYSLPTTALIAPVGSLVYTTGNLLANMPFPACKYVTEHQTRLVFTGCEQPNRIYYTEERTDGLFPGFNPVYAIEADQAAGRVSAVASMDDKLIVLQERQVGVVLGRGPNLLGLDNNFSNVTRVATGYGHSWNQSNVVAQDSAGVWFRDRQGLRHLDRSLQISKVKVNQNTVVDAGAEVDNLLVGTVGNAARRSSTKQIYFANSTGLLVWDYQFQQWSEYRRANATNYFEVVASDTDVYSLQGDDVAWTEPSGLVFDRNSAGASTLAIPLTWTGSWIRLQGLQSFQRLYKLMLLLQDVPDASSHTITVEYDYLQNNAPVAVFCDYVSGGPFVVIGTSTTPGAFDSLSIGSVIQYPNGAHGTVTFVGLDDGGNPEFITDASTGSYDSGGLPVTVFLDGFGTVARTKAISTDASPRLQIENKVAQQKCESVRITYSHSSVNGGVRCAGMTLQLGTKKGTFKLPSSHRAT